METVAWSSSVRRSSVSSIAAPDAGGGSAGVVDDCSAGGAASLSARVGCPVAACSSTSPSGLKDGDGGVEQLGEAKQRFLHCCSRRWRRIGRCGGRLLSRRCGVVVGPSWLPRRRLLFNIAVRTEDAQVLKDDETPDVPPPTGPVPDTTETENSSSSPQQPPPAEQFGEATMREGRRGSGVAYAVGVSPISLMLFSLRSVTLVLLRYRGTLMYVCCFKFICALTPTPPYLVNAS
ncbi:uncharacterized protein LOC133351356 [Lethenteron reissneri]|uniref:uncharacterized protein LOC133351356 n=1 Tax=Lethenteron reissneri TaxID=7753 RepID=UPI002AB7A751|nr:uncharacterized protein LOC133351356 [Lethenteron reissneri]